MSSFLLVLPLSRSNFAINNGCSEPSIPQFAFRPFHSRPVILEQIIAFRSSIYHIQLKPLLKIQSVTIMFVCVACLRPIDLYQAFHVQAEIIKADAQRVHFTHMEH